MRIIAREYEQAEKKTSTGVLLKVIGTLQFFAATGAVFLFYPAFVRELGGLGMTVCVVVALVAGTSASVLSFALAEMLDYLHAIRWNTDGYSVHREKGDRRTDERDEQQEVLV